MGGRRAKRTWWKWALAGLGLVGFAFAIACWLLFQHVPEWYQPVEVRPDQLAQVQADLVRTSDALNERMVRAARPFEFQISQDQVNAWLGAREDIWPLSREWLPAGVSDPFVTVDETGIRLAATVQRGSVHTVVSAHFSVAADERQIRIQLLGVNSGSLPIPVSWIEEQLVRFQHERGNSLFGSTASGDGNPISLGNLAEGITLSNEGTWRQLDLPPRRYRVIGLKLGAGTLKATIQPLR